MDTKELTRSFFALIDEMQSGKTPWSRFDDIITPSFKAFVPGQMLEADGFKKVMQTFGEGFSDSSHTIYDLAAEANVVMVRELWQGVQTGVFLGVEPTGQRVESMVMALLKFKDGKVDEFHESFDTLDLMRKTGVLTQ